MIHSACRTVLPALAIFFFCVLFSGEGAGDACAAASDKAGAYTVRVTTDTAAEGPFRETKSSVQHTPGAKNGNTGKGGFDTIIIIINEDDSPVSDSTGTPDTTSKKKASKQGAVLQEKQKPALKPSPKAEPRARQKASKTSASSGDVRSAATGENYHFGIGGYVNTVNTSAGGGFVLWPFKNIAVQGSYGVGTFTSYEARMFYRFPVSKRLRPYFGAGYLHAERRATVTGIDVTIRGNSMSVFAGAEAPLYKNLHAYADISGTPMKLKRDVDNGTTTASATVKYYPVTVNAGIVWYLF